MLFLGRVQKPFFGGWGGGGVMRFLNSSFLGQIQNMYRNKLCVSCVSQHILNLFCAIFDYREATGEVINDHNTLVYTCSHEMRCDMAHKYISRLGPPSIANLP